jgi:hypothetical protein
MIITISSSSTTSLDSRDRRPPQGPYVETFTRKFVINLSSRKSFMSPLLGNTAWHAALEPRSSCWTVRDDSWWCIQTG